MTRTINETHDPALQSWVSSANEPSSDFPIQNLPFGRFRRSELEKWSMGVAIGDQILDLRRAGLTSVEGMNQLMTLSLADRAELRLALSRGLRLGSVRQSEWEKALVPQSEVELGLPCEIGDYTDFYSSLQHATAVGRLFRPDSPLLPNYHWLPVGYHGRSSSICASGHSFPRPIGQTRLPGAEIPELKPSLRLDYELELGIFIGQPNTLGDPIALADAEAHLFGLALFNDWSARDIQAWEYQPLGPFLSKNFMSTLSPWMVTMEALAPFRAAYSRSDGTPELLPYLDSAANCEGGAFDIVVEVWLQTAKMAEVSQPAQCLSQANYRGAHWTPAQLVAHHTVNGCNLQSGDLLGTGTLSGPEPHQAGSLLELSMGGQQPITLANGELRTFLENGDTVILRGYCEGPGRRRIGFGECRGTVLPPRRSWPAQPETADG